MEEKENKELVVPVLFYDLYIKPSEIQQISIFDNPIHEADLKSILSFTPDFSIEQQFENEDTTFKILSTNEDNYFFASYESLSNLSNKPLETFVDGKTAEPLNTLPKSRKRNYLLIDIEKNILAVFDIKNQKIFLDAFRRILNKKTKLYNIDIVPKFIQDWEKYIKSYFSSINKIDLVYTREKENNIAPLHKLDLDSLNPHVEKATLSLNIKPKSTVLTDIKSNINQKQFEKINIFGKTSNSKEQVIDILQKEIHLKTWTEIGFADNSHNEETLYFKKLKSAIDEIRLQD